MFDIFVANVLIPWTFSFPRNIESMFLNQMLTLFEKKPKIEVLVTFKVPKSREITCCIK